MNPSFSSYNRARYLRTLVRTKFDLLVIGGGVTGCGIALDAASRGLKVALIEKGDFASGTSSKSTKLVHGGLRYLKQLDIGLVKESGSEREIVNRIAPHLCLPEKMLLPLVEGGTFGKHSTSAALWLYDRLAGVEKSDRRKMLTKEETLEKEPLLKGARLKGGGIYSEYRTDDARLTIELIKKAVAHKAVASNYVEAVNFQEKKGKLSTIQCRDRITNEQFDIRSKKIVAAGGPWVDRLRKKNSSLTSKRIVFSKGVHIVVPRERFPLRQSIYFDVPDGRMIFGIPRGKVTYVGTTDTFYTGSLNRIVATEEDRAYLLKAINYMFPSLVLTRFDVISNWAGVRALISEKGKSPSELSRKDEIFEAANGLICIAGGKLTGYRRMSERIVDKVLMQLKEEEDYIFIQSNTKNISLTPKIIGDNQAVEQYVLSITKKCKKAGLDPYYGWYLVTNYGAQADEILQTMKARNDHDKDIALSIAEVEFCLNHEMIQRSDDFFIRRTGRVYFDIYSLNKIQIPVTNYLSKKLKWSVERLNQEMEIMKGAIKDATHYYHEEFKVNRMSEPII